MRKSQLSLLTFTILLVCSAMLISGCSRYKHTNHKLKAACEAGCEYSCKKMRESGCNSCSKGKVSDGECSYKDKRSHKVGQKGGCSKCKKSLDGDHKGCNKKDCGKKGDKKDCAGCSKCKDSSSCDMKCSCDSCKDKNKPCTKKKDCGDSSCASKR